jgi:DNA-binding XRE family transcriptional regulator
MKNIPYITNAKRMVDELISQHGYSIAYLAEKIGVSQKTIQRLRMNKQPMRKTELHLLYFYWNCRVQQEN